MMIVFFIAVCFGCVNGINEQEVLDAFTDVYDMMYDIRDTQAEQIKKLINSDLEKNQEIEYLKLQIQELQKSNAPATCSELVKQGIARSQDIFLDSDGLNSGEKPVKAFCDFANNITKVGADKVISIKQCGSPKCFREEIQYENSVDQLVTLAEKSDNCYQQVTFDCLSSPLEVKHFEFS